jgi:Protein of unknown function DUF262/Protein of unknown function (DUF1524)
MDTVASEARLEPTYVGDIKGRFFVPAYQRGYRWGEVEVTNLLDDIRENYGKPYYLQPIVVRKHGDEWELIDGQQRLTTLFLIFRYMEREQLQRRGANYSLRYETRERSANFVEAPDREGSKENIDYFHIYTAYNCIQRWFERYGERLGFEANEFYGALFKHVQVIWYQAPDDVDGNALFRRLNVGRIPLTDAELVKAMLLTRSKRDRKDGDRSVEIAAQWDAIERDLREPELWAFTTGKTAQDATHIDLLLDSLAGGKIGSERPAFHTFNELRDQIEKQPHPFWDDVIELHGIALGWYADLNLFHKIGFLIAEGRVTLGQLIKEAKEETKSEFDAHLDSRIRDYLDLTPSGLRDLLYKSEKTARVLFLMNVETIRRRNLERYSFSEHASGHWSLEHIHAQSAETIRSSKPHWRTWLELQRDALEALDADDAEKKQAVLLRTKEVLDAPDIKERAFQDLEMAYTALLSLPAEGSEDAMHSIGNLALLDSGANSALGNSVFAVKRAVILRRDMDGEYIPVCTRNVFLKYYSPPEEQQLHFWSTLDRQYYLDKMTAVLANYLKDEDKEPTA